MTTEKLLPDAGARCIGVQDGDLTSAQAREERSAFAASAIEVERVSEPMKIGKHEWRLTTYWAESLEYVGENEPHRDDSLPAGFRRAERRFTGFEWRSAGAGGPWYRDTEWPRYDSNNGETAGLPRTLKKLWARCPWAHGRSQVRERGGAR